MPGVGPQLAGGTGVDGSRKSGRGGTGVLVDNFDVLTVPGLLTWFDASDAASVIHASGVVSAWNDKSPNGYHMGTVVSGGPTTNSRTRNGLNVIDFAPNDGLVATSGPNLFDTDALATFIVYAADTQVPASQGIFGFVRAAGHDFRNFVLEKRTTNAAMTFGDGSTPVGGSGDFLGRHTAHNSTGWHQHTAMVSAAGTEVYRIDAAASTLSTYAGTMPVSGYMADTASAVFAPFVGHRRQNASFSFYLDGGIAEIISTSVIPSNALRDQIEAYLKAKWGTP